MNRWALIATLAIAPAFAAGPDDFRSTAPVEVKGGDPLNRLTLPVEAYRDARRDLGDIRVFNAKGEPLPIAFAGEAEPKREAPAAKELALFPVSAPPPGRVSSESLDVVVRRGRDSTIISVQGRTRGAPAPQNPTAWLADASALETPVSALLVDWNVGPGTEVVRVSVEASDDLRYWRPVTSRAPLLRLEQAGQVLSQPRIEVGFLKAKYLRITGEPAAFALRSLRAQPGEVVKPPERLKESYVGKPGAKPGEYLFDLFARLPVEAVRVVPGETNSIAPFTISARDSDKDPWRKVAFATFYRLTREGVELESPPVDIAPRPMRYWMIQLDPRSPGLGSTMPQLEVRWHPAQVVFVARGDGPYTLAFGNTEAKRAVLTVGELIPGYKLRDELKLPEAKVGAVETRPENPIQKVLGEVNPRKAALWAILVAAVAALGFMAWRLRKQMTADEAATNAPKA